MRNTPGPGRNRPPRRFNTSSISHALPSLSDPPRNRTEPSVLPPAPSHNYLAVAEAAWDTVSSTAAAKLDPLVVVLSLNETLLFRPKRTARGSVNPIVRPYLSTFLSYLFRRGSSSSSASGKCEREIQVVIYSAARAHNVLALLRAVDMVSPTASTDYDGAYRPRADDGDVVKLVFTREKMNLRDEDYRADVVTVKNLDGVWIDLGVSPEAGARSTVLLEEDERAAAVQPHSRVPIVPFTVADPSITIHRRNVLVQELSSSAPDDTALLSTIHLLERLRCTSNVAAALKGGLVRTARDDARRVIREREALSDRETVTDKQVQGELAQLGRGVCAKYGIEVRREWDDGWREKARV